MQRTYGYFEHAKALLHYSRYGKGGKVLICFHGFGQTNEHFKALEEALKEEYTLYSFDLFYHGKSFWHGKDKPLTKQLWAEMIGGFLEEKGIKEFSLLGFSMGGKFALGMLEAYPERVKKLILIAPDGIKTNFWYNLATYPGWMQKIFRRIVVKPGVYFSLVNLLSSLKLVDKSILRFANSQMKTTRQRRRVYYSWIVFKDLKFDMKAIAAVLNDRGIPFELFLGKYDKIITEKNMNLLLDKLKEYKLHVLESGHSSLIEAVAEHFGNFKF